MKRFFLILAIIVLFPGYSFAFSTILFPGKDAAGDNYILSIYKDSFVIYGDNDDFLPNPDFKKYIKAGPATNAMEMAARNAWIAMLLSAQTTGKQVYVFFSMNIVEAAQGIGQPFIGNIFSVELY